MNHPHFSRMLLIALSACLALLAGCSSGPQIITNAAPDFDVSRYRSYAYIEPLSTDRGSTRSLTSQQLIESTDFQLEALGLTRDNSNPDLLVNFFTSSRETIESRPTAGPTMSMSYGRGRYGTWGGYGMGVGTTTEVVQRTEGTLRIDIIDRQRNELVWEGAATARITESMQQNRNAVINSAVNSIFAQFP